jgi:serine/threonine-protein kinase
LAEAEALLQRVADLITDDVDVDWDREAPDEESRGILRPLRALADIARFHRSALRDAPAESRTVRLDVDATGSGSTATSPTPARWGHLQIRERLGEGGFGEVYRAYDPRLKREVALKLLKRGTGGSLLEEGRNLARVRHPNVLAVHGVDQHDGRVGLWMDLLEGTDLQDVVQTRGAMGAREAAVVGIELCRALAALHQAELLHCDIKPRNIRRETGGRIVLMDLGGARDATGVRTGGPGTPYFLAPEILEGAPWSVAADIYSLGVSLFWLVTKTYPVAARNLPELRDRHRAGESVRLRDVRADLPAVFVSVVEQAIAPDPADRLPTAGAMEHALARSLEVSTEGGTPAPVDRPWWKRARARAFAVGGALVLAAVASSLLRPTGNLTAEAAIYAVGGPDGDRPLAPEEVIPLGGALYVQIQGDEDMFVYALNEDSQGEFHVLFPLTESADPLVAGVRHRLPESNRAWGVSSEGGRERIVVIASRERLEDLEAEIADAPRAAEEGNRGVGAVVETEAPSKSTQLGEITSLLLRRRSDRDGIRTWEFTFRSTRP